MPLIYALIYDQQNFTKQTATVLLTEIIVNMYLK